MTLSKFSESDAELFFKQDYHDQGMAKWQGFRLAEHIESVDRYLTEEAIQRNLTYHDAMTTEDVSNILATAWATKQQVQIQLPLKNEEGLLHMTMSGHVRGFTPDNELILSTKVIPLDEIHWCKLI